MLFRALALSLALLALAGCGSDDAREPAAESTTPTVPTVPTASVPQEAPAIVALYFLRDGKIGLAQRSVIAGPQIGKATLEALLAGPTNADRKAGLGSAIPAGTSLERLAISDGTARADFSVDLSPEAAAQVVFTLTQFPTVRRVTVNGAELAGRAALEDLTPQILVESPAPWEKISSPVRITGTANTFEATFQVEVRSLRDGRVLGKRFVTATSGSGTRGTFDAKVPFRAERTDAVLALVVYELSAEDGSRIHEVEIPLVLGS